MGCVRNVQKRRMNKEFVVVYWAHDSKRYVAVGIEDENEAKEYARKLEGFDTVVKVFVMPSRVEMSERTDKLDRVRKLW